MKLTHCPILLNMDCELELPSLTLEDSSTFVNGRKRLLQQWDMSGFTDRGSLFAHLISPNTKEVDNKRLATDLSALKQLIWDSRDDCDEEVDGSKGDYPRWIDTSAMLSDCSTKTMTSCLLIQTLRTGVFDMRPTEESLAIKAKNRKWREMKKEQERLQDSDT